MHRYEIPGAVFNLPRPNVSSLPTNMPGLPNLSGLPPLPGIKIYFVVTMEPNKEQSLLDWPGYFSSFWVCLKNSQKWICVSRKILLTEAPSLHICQRNWELKWLNWATLYAVLTQLGLSGLAEIKRSWLYEVYLTHSILTAKQFFCAFFEKSSGLFFNFKT